MNTRQLVLVVVWAVLALGGLLAASVVLHRNPASDKETASTAFAFVFVPVVFGWAWPVAGLVALVWYMARVAHWGVGLFVTPPDKVIEEAEREVEQLLKE